MEVLLPSVSTTNTPAGPIFNPAYHMKPVTMRIAMKVLTPVEATV